MGEPVKRVDEVYACVYAREFPAQAMLRLRPELTGQGCAILDGEPPLQTVCAMNSRARSLGVVRAMTRIELETIPGVTAIQRSRLEETASRAAALEYATTFSPRIEDCSVGHFFCCVLDIAGTEKLFGSPDVLATKLQHGLQSIGIASSVAVSSNFHTAVCLARGASKHTVIFVGAGEEPAALARLPLSVLELSEEHANTFASWGIRTLGMLAALPELELIARMGQVAKRYRELALGASSHHFLPIEEIFDLDECMELDTPVIVLESLLFAMGALLEQLIRRATAHVVALATVTVTLDLEGGGRYTRMVRTALPTNNKLIWIRLFHLELEACPPHAGIIVLSLMADPGHISKVQLGLFSPQLPETGILDLTLARIRGIVGESNAGRPVLKDSHRLDNAGVEMFSVTTCGKSVNKAAKSMAAIRQIRPPEAAIVTLVAMRPEAIIFRARHYVVEHAYGPWFTSGEWWSEDNWGEEQWDLIARADNSSLLCCCLVREIKTNTCHITALYD